MTVTEKRMPFGPTTTVLQNCLSISDGVFLLHNQSACCCCNVKFNCGKDMHVVFACIEVRGQPRYSRIEAGSHIEIGSESTP